MLGLIGSLDIDGSTVASPIGTEVREALIGSRCWKFLIDGTTLGELSKIVLKGAVREGS